MKKTEAVRQLDILQSLIRTRARKILQERLDNEEEAPEEEAPEEEAPEEEAPEKEAPAAEPKEPVKAEPKAPAKPEPKEPEVTPEIITSTNLLIAKVKRADGTPEEEDVIDAMTTILQAWGFSSEIKLSILKTVRNNTIH